MAEYGITSTSINHHMDMRRNIDIQPSSPVVLHRHQFLPFPESPSPFTLTLYAQELLPS